MKNSSELAAQAARELAAELGLRNLKIVFAESCTAGLVSATLAQVAGISNYLCGSAVTYRLATKTSWLGIGEDILSTHSAESSTVTDSMAIEVLKKTPEADWSAAVTGHLGPSAPVEKDGKIFVSLASKSENKLQLINSMQFKLVGSDRTPRQLEAATIVLNQMLIAISSSDQA